MSVEELADRVLSYSAVLPRELMDAFVPPRTPGGRTIERVDVHSIGEAMTRVATGKMVHATVRSFLDRYAFPGVTGIPIRDLPASETALVWLTANHSRKIEAFASTAADVIARADSNA